MGNKTNKKRKRKHQLRNIAKKRRDANASATRLQPINSNDETPLTLDQDLLVNDPIDQQLLVPYDNDPSLVEQNGPSTLDVSASEKKIGKN